MGRRIWLLIVVITGLAFIASVGHTSTHEFFQGKTIHIIVGFSAGGGFDIYSRAVGRHLGRHIPGNPSVIVGNMTGAGSLIAANHVYKVAKPDGLTIGHFIGGLFMQQLLGRQGIEFDTRRFEYVGAPVRDHTVCALAKASGIMNMETWLASKTPIKLGGITPGSNTDDVPAILQVALGLPLRLVSGYKGTPDIRLAVDSGEVAGICGANWSTVRATWSKAIESGDTVVVLQAMPQSHPDLPKVPLAISFAKTEEARQLIQAGIHDMSVIMRPYVLPPGTPKERVQILRRAFTDTMKDPEFLADAKKSKLDIDPITGEELEGTAAGLFRLSPGMVVRLKEVLK